VCALRFFFVFALLRFATHFVPELRDLRGVMGSSVSKEQKGAAKLEVVAGIFRKSGHVDGAPYLSQFRSPMAVALWRDTAFVGDSWTVRQIDDISTARARAGEMVGFGS
jgi:hypothetical protein